ncbi:hypothetical protein [Streptomyces sp. NPDC048473]|uniref:hypothetical protein n=1 Tax=unclassified Streptomyces TaxID=2593676 RepID=UPI003713746C
MPGVRFPGTRGQYGERRGVQHRICPYDVRRTEPPAEESDQVALVRVAPLVGHDMPALDSVRSDVTSTFLPVRAACCSAASSPASSVPSESPDAALVLAADA